VDFAVVLFNHLNPGETIFATNAAISPSCSNTCNYASDNDCDDGGPGAEYTLCTQGTDCLDCGSHGSSSVGFSDGIHVQFTATAQMRAGTVLAWSDLLASWVGGPFSLASGGDELIIYRGTRAAPTFLCGFCNRAAGGCGFSNIPGASSAPVGVWNYLHPSAFSVYSTPSSSADAYYDQWIYDTRAAGANAPTSGSALGLLQAISNRSHWFSSNTLFFPIVSLVPSGGYQIWFAPSTPPPRPRK